MDEHEKAEKFFLANRDAIIALPWRFFHGRATLDVPNLNEAQNALVKQMAEHHFGRLQDSEYSATAFGYKKHSMRDIIIQRAKYNAAASIAPILAQLPWHMSRGQLYAAGTTDIYLDKKEVPASQRTLFKTAQELDAIEKDIYGKDKLRQIYLAKNAALLEILCDRFDVDIDRRVNVRPEKEGWIVR